MREKFPKHREMVALAIGLALGRDVGMADDVTRLDAMGRQDRPAQLDEGFDLHRRIVVAIAVQVDDLDADRTQVERLVAAPMRAPGMPGHAVLAHEAIDRAVLGQHIVAADAMRSRSVGEDGERIGEAELGIVQHEMIDRHAGRTLGVIR